MLKKRRNLKKQNCAAEPLNERNFGQKRKEGR